MYKIKLSSFGKNFGRMMLTTAFYSLLAHSALSQEIDYKNLDRQPYLEKKVLGISKDYDLNNKGFLWTEFKDTENKDRGFRRLQFYNQKGDLVEVIDFENDGWIMNNSDAKKDKDNTIDGVCITNLLEGKFRRSIPKEGEEGKSFYDEATKTYNDKVKELTSKEEKPDKNLLK